MNSIDVTSVLAAAPGELSFIALFWQAHIVVKIVMVGLLLASIWAWAIIVEKSLTLGRARPGT